MMGPGDGYPGHVHAHHPAHHPMPMDLHVPQGFPYYRYRNEAFCWPERKPGVDDMTGQGSMNPRQAFDQTGRFPPATQAMPILELRKEKSRDAARSRRGKENYEFYELAKMLPLPAAITSQLDKASIIRLTISYLKLKDFSAHGDPPWLRDPPAKKGTGRPRSSGNATLDLFEQHQGTHILQSLDGFAFSLAADGRFLYISETVSIYLGLSQVEMTGSSVFDYIHQGDHAELAEQLGLGLAHGPGANVPSPSGSEDGSSNSATNNPDVASIMSITSNLGYKGLDRAFCIRMKSTLTKRGCHFKSSGYRVVLVLCRLRPQYSFSHTRKSPPPLLGMVALAIALPPPSVHEIRLESDMFVTRLTFDFKVIHCEPRVSELLDYTSEELTGRNLYALCHAEDVNKLRKCHVDLLSKGQVMSQYFRIMNKSGGWTWIQSCATVVCSTKNSDEQNIICVNYVLSGKEDPHIVMDCCQLDQDCPPAVKREVVDDRDRKSPDRDSSDGSGRGRDGPVGSQHMDSTRSPSARSGAASERSPDIREGAPGRERRTNLQQKASSASSRLAESSIPVLPPETQPLTPISASNPDRLEARTPQSVRSIDSEPFTNPIPPPGKNAPAQAGTKGRKRKLDRTNQNVTRINTSAAASSMANGGEGQMHLNPAGAAHPHHNTHSHNHSTPCAKRQIIVQNEVMDGNGLGSISATNGGGSVTPGSGGAENGTSPHHNNIDADNSGDSIRWRKNHNQHWDGSGGSSVKDLEHVMSKHLPGRDNDHVPSIVTSGIDFSADSLLRQQPGSRNGSAIQWVGPGSQTGSGLPVSALLRQLCASRESVIRANVQAAAAAAVVAARGASSYYPDMSTVQSALPTPPGSDNYASESQFMLSSHHSAHKQASSSDFPPLVPYTSVSAYDYQPAMTPPASVSPRDKPSYSSSGSDPNITYGDPSISNSTSFRPPQSYLDGPAQPLPLKPQVYGYHPHSSLESQYGNALADHGHGHGQSQFYPPPHTGFHLYHPTKQSYGDALKNANWYSTTS